MDLLRVKEVCRFFGGINPATLYRGIRKGRYPQRLAPALAAGCAECEAALAQMAEGRVVR